MCWAPASTPITSPEAGRTSGVPVCIGALRGRRQNLLPGFIYRKWRCSIWGAEPGFVGSPDSSRPSWGRQPLGRTLIIFVSASLSKKPWRWVIKGWSFRNSDSGRRRFPRRSFRPSAKAAAVADFVDRPWGLVFYPRVVPGNCLSWKEAQGREHFLPTIHAGRP